MPNEQDTPAATESFKERISLFERLYGGKKKSVAPVFQPARGGYAPPSMDSGAAKVNYVPMVADDADKSPHLTLNSGRHSRVPSRGTSPKIEQKSEAVRLNIEHPGRQSIVSADVSREVGVSESFSSSRAAIERLLGGGKSVSHADKREPAVSAPQISYQRNEASLAEVGPSSDMVFEQQPALPLSSTDESGSQVANAINEFYSVQRKFHHDISGLIDVLTGTIAHVPFEQRAHFYELLMPYRQLAENPFANEPTGDLITDLQHIFDVANTKNERFSAAIKALQDATANLHHFKSEIERLKDDKVFAAHIARVAPSSMRLNAAVDLPFQHLVRYELVLATIKKELTNAGYTATDEALSIVLSSIENINPVIKHINEHMEVFALLNRAEEVVYTLCGVEGARMVVNEEVDDQAKAKHQMLLAVYDTLRNSKEYLAKGGEDVTALLEGALCVLEGVHKEYDAENQSWSAYAYNSLMYPVTLFSGNADAQNNPVVKLQKVVEDLKDIIGVAQAIDCARELVMNRPS